MFCFCGETLVSGKDVDKKEERKGRFEEFTQQI